VNSDESIECAKNYECQFPLLQVIEY